MTSKGGTILKISGLVISLGKQTTFHDATTSWNGPTLFQEVACVADEKRGGEGEGKKHESSPFFPSSLSIPSRHLLRRLPQRRIAASSSLDIFTDASDAAVWCLFRWSMVLLFVSGSLHSPIQGHYGLRFYRIDVYMGTFTCLSELVICCENQSFVHILSSGISRCEDICLCCVICCIFTLNTTRCTHPWCDQLLCWLPLSFASHQVPTPLSDCQQGSNVRTTCSLDQLHVDTTEYLLSGLAESTHRPDNASQQQFLSVWDTYGFITLPVSEDTLTLLVTSLAGP